MILNGRAIAKKILADIQIEAAKFKKRPALATILIGDDEASKIYIARKKKIAQKLNFGFKSYYFDLANLSSPQAKTDSFAIKQESRERLILEKRILKLIDRLNQDKNICGFLIQFPLPSFLQADRLILRIDPRKDIDGFHPQNIKKFLQLKNYQTFNLVDKKKERNFLTPVTPTAVVEIIKASGIKLKKQKVVVAGRPSIFLTPLIHFFTLYGLSLTSVYPKTQNETKDGLNFQNFLSEVKSADILITALGRAKFIKKEMIRPGVFIIDVGINRLNGQVVGDVDFAQVAPLCSYITPVSGGVGPVTLAALMSNVLKAYQLNN